MNVNKADDIKQLAGTAPLPPPEQPLLDWLSRLKQWFDVVGVPQRFLSAPPQMDGVDPNTTLKVLIDARERLWVNDREFDPHQEMVSRHSGNWAGDNRKANLESFLREMVLGMDGAIGRMLQSGADDKRIVRTADFEGSIMRLAFCNQDDVDVFTGSLSALPENHRLRTVLPADDFYYFGEGGVNPQPALVLGLPVPTFMGKGRDPRPFYCLDDCLSLTRSMRVWQKRQAEEKARKEKDEREARIREFWNSDLGWQEKARIELEELRARGEIPPLVYDQPAVRPGGRPVGRIPEIGKKA